MAFAGVVLVFFAAVGGILTGTRLAAIPKLSRKVLAASGALLIAISVLLIVPEVAQHRGWLNALLWVVVGLAVIWCIDRFLYPICPTCSHSHDHGHCAAPLHGFAAPLLIAIAVHSFIDGWALAASEQGSDLVRIAFLAGIGLHKIPEGLALGAIVRASMVSHWRSMTACIIAEAMTLAGGAAGLGAAAYLGSAWVGILLAAAAGTFIYLGYHAIEAELPRRLARE